MPGGQTVLFAIATRQMAPTLAAVIATGEALKVKPDVVWIEDRVAKQAGWLNHSEGILESRGYQKPIKVELERSLDLSSARDVLSDYSRAGRFVFCAQGGRKIESLMFYSALMADGKPFAVSYLENRPIRLKLIESNNSVTQEKSIFPDKAWHSPSALEIIQCSGFIAHKPNPSTKPKREGDYFEKRVESEIRNWLNKKPKEVKSCVAEVQRGIEITDKESAQPKTDWDVSIVLRDGTVILFECKAFGEHAKMGEHFPVKEIQSRILILEETASSVARIFVTVLIGKNHAKTPDGLSGTWRKLDRHFSNAIRCSWISIMGGQKAEESRLGLYQRDSGPKIETFDTYLDTILQPYLPARLADPPSPTHTD